jgi:hypothetical protein
MMKKIYSLILAILVLQGMVLGQIKTSPTEKDSTTKATDATIKMDTPEIEKVSIGVSKISFKETVHDFGNVKQNNPATCVFEFINKGTTVIALETVQASCGCTTPDWTRDPVAIGGKGKITATYNSVASGSFSKTITVKFSTGEMEYLTIKGIVDAPPSVPAKPVTLPNN